MSGCVLTFLASRANLNVRMVSLKYFSENLTVQMMDVLELPPKLSLRIYVNFDSRNGIFKNQIKRIFL